MSICDLSDQLCIKVPLFAGLSPAECGQVLKIADQCEFKAGDIVLHQGGMMQRLWIVLEGEVEILKQLDAGNKQPPLTLATLGPYANFGEMSFFHKQPHSASVRAKTPVKLVRIDRERFDELAKRDSHATYRIASNTIESLADRMRRMDDWVAELLGKQRPQKVDEWNKLREQLFDKLSL